MAPEQAQQQLPAPLLLYVEDEVLIQEAVVDALEEAGFTTIVANDGARAVKLLEAEDGEDIRGLITDINLGRGIDGWEVARIGREEVPDLPVVYVSGASAHEWTSQGVPNSLMITKPFAPAQIVVAIASLLVKSDGSP